MKLVLYSGNEVVETLSNLDNVSVNGNNVTWSDGSLLGINCNFTTLTDDEEFSMDIILEREKQVKIDELSDVCEVKIMEGFDCPATGYYYRLNDKDQDNFSQRLSTILVVGKDNYTKPIYWRTGKEGDGVYVLHTVDQFLAAIDGADDHKTNCTMRYSQLKEYVKTLTTVEDVKAVNWDTVIA